jgi:hypothetical protein
MSSWRNAKKSCTSLVEDSDVLNKYAGPFFVQENKSNHKVTIDALKDKLKSIQWHKLANEASLQASLIRRKQARLSKIQSKQKSERETQARRMHPTKQALQEERRTSWREEDRIFESKVCRNKVNETRKSHKQMHSIKKGKEVAGMSEEKRGSKATSSNMRRKSEADNGRTLSSDCRAVVSSLQHVASSNDLCNECPKRHTGEFSEEVRCPKEAPLPSVLTTLDKVISLEERIRKLSDSQNTLARDWLFASRTDWLDEQESKQLPPPKSQDAIGAEEGISKELQQPKTQHKPRFSNPNQRHQRVRFEMSCSGAGAKSQSSNHLQEILSDDKGDIDSSSKRNNLLQNEGSRAANTSIPRSLGYRAASYDHLKIPNNLPSQKRIKAFENDKQNRRSSC